ncbi:hypothetical protein [Legionella jordanis]|uniref:ATPases involved in biogenesis of archaeal flagella n=1 Tax=Legionella jordanis TaxID=456 RepID=A0A0W0VAD2_9GAMM|nr:hypothetical protein [Legionella jordanis]KTD16585.1 ATPases involved in biogenesis of archaeal flagella [Legionella jordanis]RMX03876.1 alpha/beta hydrolase [Legionella jordanis]VEH11951.1 ATPases involved in biogenesis of archaeal flagella [Legionella jordanis]HAT8712745.1 alpha/beta hydrolase [Legionella jordanis]
MRFLLGFGLLFFLNFAEVAAASLDILAKQQKIAVPYMVFKGKRQRGAVVIVNSEEKTQGSEFIDELGENLTTLGWSVAVLKSSLQIQTVSWIEQLVATLSALQKNNDRVIVIHYGSKLQNAVDYFSKPQSKQPNGMILLSAFDEQRTTDAEFINKIPFPLFDITGQWDYNPVLDQAVHRKKHCKKIAYLARQLPGAGHDYAYNREILIANIHGWMKKLELNTREKPPILLEKGQNTVH